MSVPYLPGCSLLIPVAMLGAVGGFDPAFFLYGEDVDLCLRARRLGWGLALDHSSVVVHRSSSGTTVAARERLMAGMSLLIVARYFPWVIPVALPVALLTAVKRAIGRNQPWLISSRLWGYADQILAWFRPRYDSERFPSIR